MCRHHDDRRPRQRRCWMDLRDGHQPSCALGAQYREAPLGLFARSRSSPDVYRGSLAASIRDDHGSRRTHPRALRSQWSAAALGVPGGLGCRPALQNDPRVQSSDDERHREAEGTVVSSTTGYHAGSKLWSPPLRPHQETSLNPSGSAGAQATLTNSLAPCSSVASSRLLRFAGTPMQQIVTDAGEPIERPSHGERHPLD